MPTLDLAPHAAVLQAEASHGFVPEEDRAPAAHAAGSPANAREHGREDPLAELVRRMARGDESALAELYDRTSVRVFGVALRFVSDRELAEEVVSDAYFQVWNEARRYDVDRGRVMTWLLVCCRSRALDALRRRDDVPRATGPEALEQHADPGPTASDLLELMERGTAVHVALRCITPLQRQLVALSFFRGFTHSEIAAREKIPLGTVKSHIRSALKLMRRALREVQ